MTLGRGRCLSFPHPAGGWAHPPGVNHERSYPVKTKMHRNIRRRRRRRTSKSKRRGQIANGPSEASRPQLIKGNEPAETEEVDKLLLSSLHYWEVTRDLIEERKQDGAER